MAPTGRGNGHHAPSYAPLVDLDPRLADAVLDLLAAESIAAYATPAIERPVGEVVVPRVSRVLDRVFVDAEQRVRARALLDVRLPILRRQHAPPDEEAVWSAIVAAYDSPSAPDPVPRWPAAEDLPAPEDLSAPDDKAAPSEPSGVRPEQSVLRRASDPRPEAAESAAEAAAETPAPEGEEHHFVPPEPPPLPRTDAVTRWAWTGLVGAPLFLLLAAVFGVQVSDWMLLLGAGAFVGGFVTLVARMDDGPRADSGPDDGAVV